MRLICCLTLAAAGFLTWLAGAGQAAPEGAVLLSEKHVWRKHYTFITPVFADGKKATIPLRTGGRRPMPTRGIYTVCAAAPRDGWTDPGFNDGDWLVRRGREFTYRFRDARSAPKVGLKDTNVYLRGTDPFFVPVGLVCQRGRFAVGDRARVKKLTLSLTYRGGCVVYLNGREVARSHLPEGQIKPDTPATVYPPTACFYAHSLKGRPRELQPNDGRSKQWALRERTLGPVDLPLAALRDGDNVLAIKLHRAAYPDACKRGGLPCALVGLSLLELRADDRAATAQAGGLKAQVVEPTRTLYHPGALAERAGPMRVVAVRNGTFSGEVVVSRGGKPLAGLSVKMSALRRVNGHGVIPPRAVRVRYAVPNPLWPSALHRLGFPFPPPHQWQRDAGLAGGVRFDMLLDDPPRDLPACAVWVSVDVPKGILAGQYRGELTASAGVARAVTVPVQLHVADWTLPDVKDYAGLVNIYQSPETLAEYYKVATWSEKHWKLIDASMRLMAEMGNIGLFIPLLAESQMGNPESMIPWIKQRDGSYTYDFRVFDRYLQTALKHHDRDRLRFISLNVWGYEAALRTWRGPRDYAKSYGARMTVLDPTTARKTNIKLPKYGTPECEKLWEPLLHALRDRLKAKGLDGKMLLGLCADLGPDVDTAAMFHRILPGVGWVAESHNLNRGYVCDRRTKARAPVRYNSIVYGADIPDPLDRRFYGWKRRRGVLVMNFNRSGSCLLLMGYPPPWSFRIWMESTLACGRNGNGRVGGDYWRFGAKILGDGKRGWGVLGGSGGSMFGRYMHSHADEAGLGRSCTDLFGPGPNGPVSTIRLENAREGNQEAEARAYIEQALLDKRRPLPPELVKRCQQTLDERTNIVRLWRLGAAKIAPQGWRGRTRRLFETAADVRRALSR